MVTPHTTYEHQYTLSFVTLSDCQLRNSLYHNKSTISTEAEQTILEKGIATTSVEKKRKVGDSEKGANDTSVRMVGVQVISRGEKAKWEGAEVTLVDNVER